MKNPPFFSIVIPAYNAAHFIEETLESVYAQYFTDYEIIIVNDGSTDKTSELIAQCKQLSDKNITIINQENKGEGAARNKGIFAARGRYLAFLDSDDLWYPWTLETYFNVITTHDFPAILVATGREFRKQIEVVEIENQATHLITYANFYSAADKQYLPAGTPGTVVSTKEAQLVGGLGEERVNGLDQEFFLKIGLAKNLVHIVSPVTVAIRRHDGNLQHNTAMTAKGALLFISKELQGLYPGEIEWKAIRHKIIGRLARTISLQCLKTGYFGYGWKIYCKTFAWQLKQLKFKYLGGFFIMYCIARINSQFLTNK